ncbi:MAG: hypothetical protein AAF961_08590, partial [Planctomycetota bacterium]
MNSLGLSLLQCAVQVALFATATAVVYRVARRVSPRAAVNSLLVGLCLMLGLSLLAASPWPRWRLADRPSDRGANRVLEASSVNAGNRSEGKAASPTPRVDASPPAFETSAPNFSELSAAFFDALAKGPTIESKREAGWPAWLAIVVVVGVLLGGIRLALGLYGVRRLLRQATVVDEPRLNAAFDLAKRNSRLQANVALCETSQIST